MSQVIKQLTVIGQRRAKAHQELSDTRLELPVVARRAIEEGISKSHISHLVGVSRPTLDAMLD